jgi:hypothetical protein
VDVLWARVKDHYLHRTGNYLMTKLIDKPRPVYKVGLIRKERLQLHTAAKPESCSSLLR